MKHLIMIGFAAAFSAGVHAAGNALLELPKQAATMGSDAVNTGMAMMPGYKPPSLAKTAESIRKGEINVGKEYSLGEEGRFHKIHHEVLGMKCAACHTFDAYPQKHLFLRKAEFPKKVDGEKVKAVERPKCISCHSDGSVATTFYNFK